MCHKYIPRSVTTYIRSLHFILKFYSSFHNSCMTPMPVQVTVDCVGQCNCIFVCTFYSSLRSIIYHKLFWLNLLNRRVGSLVGWLAGWLVDFCIIFVVICNMRFCLFFFFVFPFLHFWFCNFGIYFWVRIFFFSSILIITHKHIHKHTRTHTHNHSH